MREIIKKAAKTNNLTEEEITLLLENSSFNGELFAAADFTRKQNVGDGVHLRALIEYGNICQNNCFYCGIRAAKKDVKRYRLDTETTLKAAALAKNLGYKTIVLQSGEENAAPLNEFLQIIKEIKNMGLALTLSIGEKTYQEYLAYREVGADRFLLRIETTDENLYQTLHPGMNLQNRLRCLKDIKKLGYETGTGIMVGLPGQTAKSIAKDILFFKELDADMLGIGPFIPCPGTPLENEKGGSLETALKVMAISRLIMPKINIPATTAMEAIEKNGRIKALQSGANVIMPNVTPQNERKNYALYPGKPGILQTPEEFLNSLKQTLSQIGRFVSQDAGMSLNYRPIEK
ncbi:Radical SAM domain protein [Elusimicrobium minutum Pei191]|uniref:Radical SAM domain protein n=1 Tax=Elusimicrobium minutum (strain Pei191) TaxID=445932 RepID=B2KED3_ELUMP|nr:[FeFe] hydrogenase H-cluster radical SAM maturase HydE [Elusimicrobium minutum]ACC98879.1 Radical SAM domain protein [Elusimicrobium minutum Pei191]